MDDDEKYDFPGSSVVIAIIFGGFLALRYFGVIKLSWWIVWPLGIGSAVVGAAIISTIVHTK